MAVKQPHLHLCLHLSFWGKASVCVGVLAPELGLHAGEPSPSCDSPALPEPCLATGFFRSLS